MQLCEHICKYPFIRLIVPFITGIGISELFSDSESIWILSIGAVIAVVLILLSGIFFDMKKIYSCRWVFGAGVYLFFFLSGYALALSRLQENMCEWENGNAVYLGVVTDNPHEKVNSMSCRVRLEEKRNNCSFLKINKNILLYLSKDSCSRKIGYGDRLMFYGQVTSPSNKGNPDEFDYARFLIRKGISGTAFVNADHWKQISRETGFDFKGYALKWREDILNTYRQLGFGRDELSVLSALTLGYKDELDDDIRESYSVAGVSHVLALSGLHIGVIFGLFSFLLKWMNRKHYLFWIKEWTIIFVLFGYAFLTGFSPSVIRAVIMCSMVALSLGFNNKALVLNTLGVAAFFMLLYDPFYLYDVGFQLSFISVIAILFIQPGLFHQIEVKNKVLKILWGMITVSIAAQLGTAPLILYYFSTFSVYFLMANLVIVFFVPFVLYGAITVLVLGFIPVMQSYIVDFLTEMLHFMNTFVETVSRLPASSFNRVYVNGADVWIFYFALVALSCYLVLKKRKALLMSLVCIALLCTYHMADSFEDFPRTMVFYNIRNTSAVHFIKSKEESYIASSDKETIRKELNYASKRFLLEHGLSEPQVLSSEYEGKSISSHKGITKFGDYTVCMLTDDYWKNKKADNPLLIDYLYVCRGYKGHLSDLCDLFLIRKVILDSSLSAYRLAMLETECRKLGLEFISVSEKGSVLIRL